MVEDQERQRDEQNDRWKVLKNDTRGCARTEVREIDMKLTKVCSAAAFNTFLH